MVAASAKGWWSQLEKRKKGREGGGAAGMAVLGFGRLILLEFWRLVFGDLLTKNSPAMAVGGG